jgi:hypothetical protein
LCADFSGVVQLTKTTATAKTIAEMYRRICLIPETISVFLLEPCGSLARLIHGKENMMGLDRDKERERFYLLPGQGGKSARQKNRRILLWSIVFGLFASGVLAGVLYLITNPVRR